MGCFLVFLKAYINYKTVKRSKAGVRRFHAMPVTVSEQKPLLGIRMFLKKIRFTQERKENNFVKQNN